MKKLNKKESASMSELLGILSYSERDTCFQLEGWGCLDIVRVICSDFQAIRDIDLEYENLKLQQFYSRYPADLKLVCVSMPERCTEQIQYVTHKLESCQETVRRNELVARKKELQWLEKNRQRNIIFSCIQNHRSSWQMPGVGQSDVWKMPD